MSHHPGPITSATGIYLTAEQQHELLTLFSAMRGQGMLVLNSGEGDFLPEIRTEDMASIWLQNANAGFAILEKAEAIVRK